MKQFRLPLKFIGVTEKYNSTSGPYYSPSNPHKGVDLGWNNNYGGKYNTPVYAVNDGIVMQVGRSTGSSNCGNYIWIRHVCSGYDLWSRYCHLKDSSTLVKQGQTVSRGQQIATMGGTYGYAEHLHYEMWKVPSGWSFNWNDREKYRVDPFIYTYLFEDQVAGQSSAGVIKCLGTSKLVGKNTANNQIEVIGNMLRVRKGAGTNQSVLGYADTGFYNYVETKTANGYTWYNIGVGWIAGTKEDTRVYPAQEKVKKIGTPVAKDTSKNQVEIITDVLRCRKSATTNSEVLGLMSKGYYDFTDTFKDNIYTWYHLVDGWVADTKDDIKIYPKTEPLPDDKDKQIEELKKQVEKLDAEILAQKSLIEEQNEKIEELTELLGNYSTLKVFEAPKKDYYYIVLNKDDKVYY